MTQTHPKLTVLAATNIAGVRAVALPDAGHGSAHPSAILDSLALRSDSAAHEVLRARITATPWPVDARIIPHLVPQIGVTHLLAPRVQPLAESSYTSNNWAGSTIPGTWTDVVGIWRVPAVSIPETPAGTNGGWDSSSWVGIDGTYGSNDVLQAGVQQSVSSDGTTSYVAWYEWFAPKVNGSPAYIYQTNIDNIEIRPGDEVFAGIHYRNGKGLVMFGNVDRGHYFTIEVDPPPGASMTGNSAEWIMEAPNTGEPGTSLPGFTPVVFSAASASSAAVGVVGDPAAGDTTNIWAFGRTLTGVALATDSLTITRAVPGWNSFALAPGASSSVHGVAAVSRRKNSMELWWVAPNGSVQGAYFNDGSPWARYELAPAGSASPTGGIAAVSRIPGSMEVFFVGANGSVQDRFFYEGSGWKGIELMPAGSAATTGGIAAVSRIPGSMEVFFVGANGSVQDRFFYEGSGWKGIELMPAGSAATTGGIAAVSRIPGSMEVFFVGANGSVQDRFFYEGSGWKGIELMPAGSAATTGGIAAVSRIPGSMEVFFVGANGSVQDRFFYEGSGWKGIELMPAGSAATTGGIAAVSRIPGSMEVFFVGANGSVQDRFFYEGSGWKGIELMPAGSAATTSGIAAVSRIPGSMELWHAGADGSIQDHYWYG